MVTRRLCNFRVTIPRGCTISRYSNPEVAQPPGNHTLKLFEKKTFLEKLNEIIVVFLLLGWTISGYCNLEIVQLPGYNIRRLHNIRE